MDAYSIVLKVIMALGGLGLFLIGMKNMGEGLELAAGSKLRNLLEKITSNKFIAMLVGVLVTGVIQSSSATDAMVVGFANAGLMEFDRQSVFCLVLRLVQPLHHFCWLLILNLSFLYLFSLVLLLLPSSRKITISITDRLQPVLVCFS